MPRRRGWPCAVLTSMVVVGCGAPPPESTPSPSGGCAMPSRSLADGRCLEPGVQDDGCPAGTVADDTGSCQPAGIPSAICAQGFVAKGDGCEPTLPASPCSDGDGVMAVPGDAACRPIEACAGGRWGDVPVDGTTKYVDASYAGGSSDGTAMHPYTKIADAVAAAQPRAIVAVAAGSYAEPLVLAKPVRLWGACPSSVAIVGSSTGPSVAIGKGGGGTEIHGIAIRGGSPAIHVSGAEEVLIEKVWVHQASGGITVSDELGAASASVDGSLLERNSGPALRLAGTEVAVTGSVVRGATSSRHFQPYDFAGIEVALGVRGARSRLSMTGSVVEATTRWGIYGHASQVSVDASVVRDTLLTAHDGGYEGQGIVVDADPARGGSTLTVARSSILGAHVNGVEAHGADVTLDGLVVRDTRPGSKWGRGVNIEIDLVTGLRSKAVVRRSVLAHNSDTGLYVAGADVTVEGVVVRDTTLSNEPGRGLVVSSALGQRSTMSARGLLLDDNRKLGLLVRGSDATLDGVVVRNTQAGSGGCCGYGAVLDGDGPERAKVTLTHSVIEGNHTVGLWVNGAAATIDSSVVRGTLPRDADGLFGRGVALHGDVLSHTRSNVTLRRSLVEGNREVGVFGSYSEVTMQNVAVRDTLARAADGLAGDGVSLIGLAGGQSVMTLAGCEVSGSHRAGISSFGADVGVGSTAILCNRIALDAETYLDVQGQLDDLHGNHCGCGDQNEDCQVLAAGLDPPIAIGSD